MENLITACRTCNSGKGAEEVERVLGEGRYLYFSESNNFEERRIFVNYLAKLGSMDISDIGWAISETSFCKTWAEALDALEENVLVQLSMEEHFRSRRSKK